MQLRVTILVVLLLGAGIAVARADRSEEIPLRMTFALFPMEMNEWQGRQNTPFSQKILDVLGVDDYVSRQYARKGDRSAVDLYIGYWQSQRQGDAIHSPQNCLPGAGWEPVEQGYLETADPRNPGGPSLSLNRYVIQKGLDRQLVLYWYQSRGRVVASEYWSKFYLIIDAARYNRTDAALVRVVVPIHRTDSAGESNAEARAVSFISEMMPRLGQYLPN